MARKRAKLTDFRPCHEVAYVPTCTASAASSASRTRTGSQPGRGVRGRGKLQAHSPATACLSTSVAPWRLTPTTPRLQRWPAHAKDLSTVEYAIGSISQYPQQGTAGNASEAHREAISVAPKCCGCLSCDRAKMNRCRVRAVIIVETHTRTRSRPLGLMTVAVAVVSHAHRHLNITNARMRAFT